MPVCLSSIYLLHSLLVPMRRSKPTVDGLTANVIFDNLREARFLLFKRRASFRNWDVIWTRLRKAYSHC